MSNFVATTKINCRQPWCGPQPTRRIHNQNSPPPLQSPTPCNPPPPPRENVTSIFFYLISVALVCVAKLLYTLHCFPITSNQSDAFCDNLSPKALYGCVVLLFETLVLYRSFRSPTTFVWDESHWHHINSKVASHLFSLLASVQGTTVCLETPLQSSPHLRETLSWRPSPPPHNRETVTR